MEINMRNPNKYYKGRTYPIIKCQECNLTMRWQVTSEEKLLYCDPCRRAVIILDGDSNSELVEK